MRIAAVSQVEMTVDPAQASAKILWKTTRFQAYCLIATSVAGMVGLLYPVLLIGADAIAHPQVVQTIAEHAGATTLLMTGIILGLTLLYFPLRSGLARLGGAGVVRLQDGQVHVERQGLLGRQQWSAPLKAYCGVTHHIRATLSGPRHEIILVHPDPAKDVLLNLAPRHPQEGAAYYGELLGLPEVQPRTLYQRQRTAPVNDMATTVDRRAA